MVQLFSSTTGKAELTLADFETLVRRTRRCWRVGRSKRGMLTSRLARLTDVGRQPLPSALCLTRVSPIARPRRPTSTVSRVALRSVTLWIEAALPCWPAHASIFFKTHARPKGIELRDLDLVLLERARTQAERDEQRRRQMRLSLAYHVSGSRSSVCAGSRRFCPPTELDARVSSCESRGRRRPP